MTAPIPSPVWQPAASRIIPITVPANLRLRGLVPEVVALSWVPKSSAEQFDFSLCAGDMLCDTGDYIAKVERVEIPTATGLDTDLTVLWSSVVNGMACVFLGGGQPGTTQTVIVYIRTQQGRHIPQEVLLAINGATSAMVPIPVPALTDGTPVPPNSMRLPDGNILLVEGYATLQFNNLLLPDGEWMLTPDGVPIGQNASVTTADILLFA